MEETNPGRSLTTASAGLPSRLPPLLALLGSRLILFLLFQALIALLAGSWDSSVPYWLVTATLTNLVSIALLVFLFRREGKSYLSLFRFDRLTLRKDVIVFIVLALLCGPVGMGPSYLLSNWLWTDPDIPFEMMFRPVEGWVSIVTVAAFPVTIAFAELATYFGYIMPRMKAGMRQAWPAVLLPVLLLSLQHVTLPFIPDLKFILYRALMFLPFATLVGIALHRRPSLFPWFAILHGVMDLGTAVIFLTL